MLSGVHFIQTSSGLPLAASLLPALKVFVSKILQREVVGSTSLFTTLRHSHKNVNPTSSAGHHGDRITAPLTQLSSLLFYTTLHILNFYRPRLMSHPDQGRLSVWVGPSPFNSFAVLSILQLDPPLSLPSSPTL